jgi:hypothetical protein
VIEKLSSWPTSLSLRHRRETRMPNLSQNSRQVQINSIVRCHILCLSSKSNRGITGNDMLAFADMSCRFGHPCRHDIFLCRRHDRRHVFLCRQHDRRLVTTCCTRHRMSPFGQQNQHADIRHKELS